MITVPKGTNIHELNTKARYLQRTRVYYEPHVSKRDIIQCKKCQTWGHATVNCFLNVIRCVKCAGTHISSECGKPRTDPAVCCNCGGSHPACSTECPHYKKAVEEKNKRSAQTTLVPKANTRQYRPAPPPSRNAWTDRGNSSSYSPSRQEFPPLRTRTNTTPPAVNSVKYLGIVLDKRLTFRDAIATNICKARAALRKLQFVMLNKHTSTKNKLLIYKAIIRPILTYGAPCWGNAANKHIRKVCVMQNKCLRLALGAGRRTPIRQLLRRAEIEPISDFIDRTTTAFFEKTADHLNPLIAAITEAPPGKHTHIFE